MAFGLPFFKKKPEEAAPAAPSDAPPTPPTPATPPPPQPPAVSVSQGSALSPSVMKKIVPRQGSLAAALKAATTSAPGGGIGQSAIFKPKVSVVLKPEKAAPAAPQEEEVPLSQATLPPDAPSTLEIPVSEIISLLPENILKPDAAALPESIALDTAAILPQLAKGRVQVPLQMLLAFFPAEAIDPSIAGAGDMQIKIPLSLIIPRLPESAISLPSTQIKQQIDASIEVPFSERKSDPPSPSGVSSAVPSEAPLPVSPPVAKPAIAPLTRSTLTPADAAKPVSVAASKPSPAAPAPLPAPKLPSVSIPVPKPALAAPLPAPAPAPSVAAIPSIPKPVSAPIPKPVIPAPAAPAAVKLPTPSIPVPPIAPSVPATPAIAIQKPQPPSIPVPSPSVPPVAPMAAPPGPAAAPAQAEPSAAASDLFQLLGITDGREVRIQEIVEKVRTQFNLLGVLVSTEDGLPLVGSMPDGLDSNAWSSIGPQLFRKFGTEGKNLSLGRPRRCLVNVNASWFTMLHDNEIYLILSHRLDAVTPEFEEQNATLVREIARYCRRQNAAA